MSNEAIILLAALVATHFLAQSPPTPSNADIKQTYAKLCAGCHGDDARGTQQGPGLAGNPWVRRRSVQSLRNVIRNGIPAAGMPAFDLPAATLDALAALVVSLNASAAESTVPGDRAAGKAVLLRQRDNAPPATWCTARARPSAPICRMSRAK